MSITERIGKKGITYELEYYVIEKGEKKRKTKNFKTKREAEAFGRKMEMEFEKTKALIESGNYFIFSDKTFDEVWNEYLETKDCEFSNQTKLSYMSIYSNHIKPVFGNEKISSIKKGMIQKFMNEKKSYSKSTLLILKNILSDTFNYSIDMDYIQTSPMQNIKTNSNKRKEANKRVLTHNEFISLTEAFENEKDIFDQSCLIAIYIGYYLGLRRSEILALCKEDFDFQNNEVNVHRKVEYIPKNGSIITERMKTKKSKAILPVCKPLKEKLIEWFKINPFDLVCTNSNGDILYACSVSSKIQKKAKSIGISDFTMHSLRRSFITNLVVNNVDIKTATELSRHSTCNMTLNIYAQTNIENMKKAIQNTFNQENSGDFPVHNILA